MTDFNIKAKPSIINFYKEENKSAEKEIELYFNLINGKMNNKYSIKVFNSENNNSLNSNFINCTNQNKINLFRYTCDYNFGKEQILKLQLMVQSNQIKLFPIKTSIGEIVGNENSKKILYIDNEEEKLEIKAETKKKKIKYLTIQFKLKISSKNSKFNISKEQEEEYFIKKENKLFFKIIKNNKLLYESEAFTDDGKFNIVQIPLYILNSDFSIQFCNYKKKIIYGITVNVNELTDPIAKNKLIYTNETLSIYNLSSIRNEVSFLDYIKNGVRIALDIGIDFTGSNGHPDDKNTLHCRRPDMKQRNPYERAILSCASIMANYDYDQLFPVYGFGAIIKGEKSKNPSMCFNINFKENPNIKFVDNIIKEYHECLDKIYFSGPTCFAPIINKIISEIKKENDILDYHVLMILTDGKIDDFQDTVDALVESSFLPLSVIIVGIGDNPDFQNMIELDGDDKPLISKNGIKRQRDLVQFVPFNKFEGDEKKLAEEVLDEIPRQIIEFYTLNFLFPESLINN